MTAPAAPQLYRLSLAHVLRVLGPAFVLLGVMWMLVALFGFSTTWARVATAVSVVAAVAGAIFAFRPPVVLKLTEQGYRVSWVRGVGTSAAQWGEVENLGTQHVGTTLALVVSLSEGRKTLLPLTLLGARGRQAVDELRRQLNSAAGRRRTH